MKDFDSIWRTQDEIRTVVNAVLGECIWNLSYNERRIAIELEITKYLEEEEVDLVDCLILCSSEVQLVSQGHAWQSLQSKSG